MKIIAFDLGSTLAWATNAPPSNVGSKTFEGKRPVRFADTQRWLERFFSEPFDVVVYETPFARGRDATRSLWGIAGILEAVATNFALPIIDVAVPTIKKFATGNGMASKLEMISAAKKFGYKVDNDHEADAVCLLNYAIANLERLVA
jgi:crossover junction endodeoxyribonuclease RuvC